MKMKMIAAVGLLAASALAQAQSVTVGYAQREMATGAQEHQTSLGVKTGALFGNVYGDAGYFSTTKDASNALSNRIEVGLNKPFAVPYASFLSANMRVATGWKLVSGSATTKYYVIEPSVTAPLGASGFDVKVGYRWRNAYDSTADNSKTTRLALGYNLTAKDKISLGYDDQRGDGAVKQTSLQYTRAF